jgi:hypothetical protein
MNALAASLQTYFTTFAHNQRDLSSNTIGSYPRHVADAAEVPDDDTRDSRRQT